MAKKFAPSDFLENIIDIDVRNLPIIRGIGCDKV
jgi:hypothetical protein